MFAWKSFLQLIYTKNEKMNTPLVSVSDFEQHAYKVLPRNALDYYKSGAGQEQTLKDNPLAFSR